MGAVERLLVQHEPHLLFLQKGRNVKGVTFILKSRVRLLGYFVLCKTDSNLICIGRRGLNVCQLKSHTKDADYRIQRLAFQVADTRVLIRHVHAPSDNHPKRVAMRRHLRAEAAGNCILDICDHNHRWPDDVQTISLYPTECTFRPEATFAFVTCIDGALVSRSIAHQPRVEALEEAQHRPVMVNLSWAPTFHEVWTLNSPIPPEPRFWLSDEKAEFERKIETDIDASWRLWASCSNLGPPIYQKSAPWGGWSVGLQHGLISKLWKRLRQLHAHGTAADDAHAAQLTGNIKDIIHTHSDERLSSWKQSVATRSGAAKWVRTKTDQMATCIVSAPDGAFTDDLAEHMQPVGGHLHLQTDEEFDSSDDGTVHALRPEEQQQQQRAHFDFNPELTARRIAPALAKRWNVSV